MSTSLPRARSRDTVRGVRRTTRSDAAAKRKPSRRIPIGDRGHIGELKRQSGNRAARRPWGDSSCASSSSGRACVRKHPLAFVAYGPVWPFGSWRDCRRADRAQGVSEPERPTQVHALVSEVSPKIHQGLLVVGEGVYLLPCGRSSDDSIDGEKACRPVGDGRGVGLADQRARTILGEPLPLHDCAAAPSASG
jgi:hypothetical protein